MIGVLIAAALAGAPAEELVLVGDDPAIGKEYVDMTSVKPHADGRTAMQRRVRATPAASDGAVRIETETVFRCEARELREGTQTRYRADGSVAETGPSITASWISVLSSPIRTKMLDTVCAKKL